MGIALFVIYTRHYEDRSTADIFKFFDDSYFMTEALWNKPKDFFQMLLGINNDSPYFNENYYDKMNNWFRLYESSMYNDSHTIIRFNALIRIFSFGHYHVHTVFMCFLVIIGLTATYRALADDFKSKQKELFAIIFLLPSTLFWGSGVLKEGLMLFGLGILIYSFFKIHQRDAQYRDLGTFLFSILLLFHLKFYVLSSLFFGLLGYTLVHKLSKNAWISYAVSALFISLIALNIHWVKPEFNALKLLQTKQKDFIGLATFENSGSQFDMTPLEPKLSSFIKTSPEALLNSFFRPFPQDANNLLMLFATVENLMVFALLLFFLFFGKIPANQSLNRFLFFLISGLTLFLIIGWTTPVSGALVRYKIPGVMMLLIAGLYCFDKEKFLSKAPIWIKKS
jgi:hypothetical protein